MDNNRTAGEGIIRAKAGDAEQSALDAAHRARTSLAIVLGQIELAAAAPLTAEAAERLRSVAKAASELHDDIETLLSITGWALTASAASTPAGGPLVHDPSRADASSEPIGPPDGPMVLVVEDDPDLRRFLEQALAQEYRVVSSASAEEGLEAARHLQPDLLLCDLVLPGASGDELVDELRNDPTLADTAVLVLTARTEEAVRVQLLRHGADDYVIKPFVLEELRARIANLIAGRLSLDQLRHSVIEAQDLASQLQHALQTRIVVEQAKGFIAAERGIPVDQALDVLRRYARGHNRKLHDVAHEVVASGFRPPS